MNRGGYPILGVPGNQKRFYVAVVGAGAAAPTVPTNAQYKTQTNAVSRVAAEIPTRSGAGAYVVFYGSDFAVPEIAQIAGQVRLSGGGVTPTAGLWVKVQSVNLATRAVTLQVRNEAGTLTDLALSDDMLVLTVDAVDSVTAI